MMQSSLVIGITGGSGSGKSAVSQIAKSLGFTIIDADKTAHEIILKGEDAYFEIIENFGDVLLPDGEINRKKLGNIVFSDKSKLELLNGITHSKIIEKIKSSLMTGKYIIDAPLLFECGLDSLCDKTVAVVADSDIRIERIVKRSNVSYEYAKGIIKNQPKDDFYIEKADAVIYNNSSLTVLENEVLGMFREFIDESNKKTD